MEVASQTSQALRTQPHNLTEEPCLAGCITADTTGALPEKREK